MSVAEKRVIECAMVRNALLVREWCLDCVCVRVCVYVRVRVCFVCVCMSVCDCG